MKLLQYQCNIAPLQLSCRMIFEWQNYTFPYKGKEFEVDCGWSVKACNNCKMPSGSNCKMPSGNICKMPSGNNCKIQLFSVLSNPTFSAISSQSILCMLLTPVAKSIAVLLTAAQYSQCENSVGSAERFKEIMQYLRQLSRHLTQHHLHPTCEETQPNTSFTTGLLSPGSVSEVIVPEQSLIRLLRATIAQIKCVCILSQLTLLSVVMQPITLHLPSKQVHLSALQEPSSSFSTYHS